MIPIAEIREKLPKHRDLRFLKEELNLKATNVHDLYKEVQRRFPGDCCPTISKGDKTKILYQIQDKLKMVTFLKSLGFRKSGQLMTIKVADLLKTCISFV
jgi:hypothetical protein